MSGIIPAQSRCITTPNDAMPEGELAAEVFERFDRGVSPVEVIIDLALPVETIESLWRTWARLREVVPVSPETVQTLREALSCSQPLTNSATITEAVRHFVERPLRRCTRCKASYPEYCTTCPAQEALRARKRTRASRKNSVAASRTKLLEKDSAAQDDPEIAVILPEFEPK